MRVYLVFINGQEAGTIEAPSHSDAKRQARKAFHVRADVIG